jgi:hypothetical protein
MEARNRCILALLFLLFPSISQAQGLRFSWQFPRDYAPAPDSFILAQTETGKPEQQAKVALSAEGACPGVVDNIHDTFCAVQAQCPAAGTIVAYWVYAQWGAAFSAPSNIAACYTAPGEPCVCHDPIAVVPAPPGGNPSPAPVVPPTPVLATEPPPQVGTAKEPLGLASANPTVPPFQIPAAPSSAGT